jgi:hypothetical protein
MRDEMDARIWVDHHEQFSDSLHNGFAAIAAGFRKLHNMQWSAPWRRSAGIECGPPQA